MTALTDAVFDQWLTRYSQASIANDPQASAELFAPDARYYESPFDEPLVGRTAIYDYWAAGAQHLTDKHATHTILAVRGQVGIARWQARFTDRRTASPIALDCVFVAEFDEQGRCNVFREWWHYREYDRPEEVAHES
jgi:hypothetical protein